MTTETKLQDCISDWIKDYATQAGIKTLVVGVSGGIDSAVVSTLCARTGLDVIAVSMPIRQRPELHDLSLKQGKWLTDNFSNVKHEIIDLTSVFNSFEDTFSSHTNTLLAFANSRARLRMMTLYQLAQNTQGIVAGTGNKVEDFGVGFYTKYGDGGVDISPIGDLYKTEVWALGQELGVPQEIIDAPPTDGLWDDGRTDEDQLSGMTYPDLELAMQQDLGEVAVSTQQQQINLDNYRAIRAKSLHKMLPIPVFKQTA